MANEKDTKVVSVVSSEFTDKQGNPVEVSSKYSVLRSAEDMARHEQRVSQRPQRPARKEK